MNKWETGMEQRPARTLATIVVGVIVFVGVILLVLWGVGVIFSPVKGAGDSYSRKNSADNFISAQAQFQDDFAQLGQFKANIKAKADEITTWEKAHPNAGQSGGYDQAAEHDAQLHSDLSGLTQQCNALVSDYNAAASKYLSEDFRTADLPFALDRADCVAPSTGG